MRLTFWPVLAAVCVLMWAPHVHASRLEDTDGSMERRAMNDARAKADREWASYRKSDHASGINWWNHLQRALSVLEAAYCVYRTIENGHCLEPNEEKLFLSPVPVIKRVKIVPYRRLLDGAVYSYSVERSETRELQETTGISAGLNIEYLSVQISKQYGVTLGSIIGEGKSVQFSADRCENWDVIVREEWHYGVVQQIYGDERELVPVKLRYDVHLQAVALC